MSILYIDKHTTKNQRQMMSVKITIVIVKITIDIYSYIVTFVLKKRQRLMETTHHLRGAHSKICKTHSDLTYTVANIKSDSLVLIDNTHYTNADSQNTLHTLGVL